MRWVVACALVAACHHPAPIPQPPTPPAPIDAAPDAPAVVDLPPALEVREPARAAFVDGAVVAVTGSVHDDTPNTRVVVNSVEAAVGADGTFVATVPIATGIATIETHAIDAAGHDVRDVRALLAGPFASTTRLVAAPVAARLGRADLAAIAGALTAQVAGLDVLQLARRANPLYEDDGCLGARVDLERLDHGPIAIALAPIPGAVDARVTVDDVRARLAIHYEIACLGGDTTASVRMRLRAQAELRAQVAGGRVRTALVPHVTLDDFDLDTAGVPARIERLLRPLIRTAIEGAAAQLLATEIPPRVDELLAHLPWPAIVGRSIAVGLAPRAITFDAAGATVAADVAIALPDAGERRYAIAPRALPATGPADPGAWIAADLANQVLANLWATGAIERTITRDQLGPLAFLIGGDVATVRIHAELPPTIARDELAVGELALATYDAAGEPLQRFVIAARGPLALAATSAPTVLVREEPRRADLARALDADTVASLVATAWGLGVAALGDALELRALVARDGMIAIERR